MASYTYDHAGRMASVTDRLGNATTFSYDASSNLIQTLFPGGDVDRDGYDNAGRLIHFSLSDSTSDPASIDIAYKRDLLGQITEATQTGTGQPSQAYGYDANGRLSRVNSNPVGYDARDNFVQGGADILTYDGANRLVSKQTPDVNWQFGYDDNGSRTSAFTLDGTRSQDFVWDAAGNLTSFTDGSTSETNTYDGLGRKVSSSAGGTSHRYIWDSRSEVWSSLRGVWGSGPTDPGIFGAVGQVTGVRVLNTANIANQGARPAGEPTGPLADGSTTFIYGPEGLPVEQIDGSGQALFYHHDQLGSTRAITDATAHTVSIVAYDEFGNQAYHSGSVNVPFGFGGGYTDPASHLVLIGHDYYDPPTGQFIARIRRAITVGQNAPVLLRSGNPAVLSVELFFDTYEKGIALGATGSPSALDVELIFDGYEKGRIPLKAGISGTTARVAQLAEGWVKPARRAGSQHHYVNVRGWQSVNQWASDLDWQRSTTLGSSPYSLGGGDPINAAKPSTLGKPLIIKVRRDEFA